MQEKESTDKKDKHKKDKPKTAGSTVIATASAVAGTALAFVVELVRLRRSKI